jgi:hypothetical protein
VVGVLAVVVVLLVPLFQTAPPPVAEPVVSLPAPAPTQQPAIPPSADSLARLAARPPTGAGATTPARPPAVTRPAAPPPAAPGRLFINATPWGQLYVDGVLIGNTPQVDVTVPAGPRVLRVVRDGYRPFETRLQVAPGQVVRLTDIVLEPVAP